MVYRKLDNLDEQQHFVTSHEGINAGNCVADPHAAKQRYYWYRVSQRSVQQIGRKTGIDIERSMGLQHRYMNFTRSGADVYQCGGHAQQTIVGVINLISNPQYMMLSFEQIV